MRDEAATEPDLERVRAFIELAPWQVAVTMPETPHEYAVRAKYVAAGGSHAEFDWVVGHIREAGWNGRWRQMRGRYLTCDGWQFWSMGWPVEQTFILNRADRSDPRSCAYPCGELRPCAALTRKGEPCRNLAEHPAIFCPIHRHLTSEPQMVRQLEFWSREPEEPE